MKKNKNVWKIIAISSIIIFSVIILLVAVRTIRFRPHTDLSDVSAEQKELALSIIGNISSSEGYSLENYTIIVDDKIREIDGNNQKHHVLMVRVEKENEIKSYLIDTDDWVVVQSSQIKYSGWMTGKQMFLPPDGNMEGRWFHNILMDKKRPR